MSIFSVDDSHSECQTRPLSLRLKRLTIYTLTIVKQNKNVVRRFDCSNVKDTRLVPCLQFFSCYKDFHSLTVLKLSSAQSLSSSSYFRFLIYGATNPPRITKVLLSKTFRCPHFPRPFFALYNSYTSGENRLQIVSFFSLSILP